MPEKLMVDLEAWDSSPVVRKVTSSYERWPANRYSDAPARLMPRQAAFYRNLIQMALTCGSSELPVDFICADGTHVYLDHGCVKIAEHAGFIQSLRNGSSGVVETITLAWSVDLK